MKLFKSLLIGIALTVSAMAQCGAPGAVTPDIYWAHQPPVVQALQGHSGDTDIASKAMLLATQGQQIDVPIMVWGWDPCKTMALRLSYGYVWVPSALQPNIEIAPGLTSPGRTSYDPKNPPKGSIIVSINAKDYPPFFTPPPPPPPATNLVGPCTGSICIIGPGATTAAARAAAGLKDGVVVTQAAVAYVFHSQNGPFGAYIWFTVK